MEPDLIVFAIPNGGNRDPKEAGRLKAEGVLAGVPDIMIARAMGLFHGLFLEFKSPSGALSPAQREVGNALGSEGYRVETVRSVREAWGITIEYLNGEHTLEALL